MLTLFMTSSMQSCVAAARAPVGRYAGQLLVKTRVNPFLAAAGNTYLGQTASSSAHKAMVSWHLLFATLHSLELHACSYT